MDHVGDRTDAVQGVEAVHRLEGVGHADGDPVALADAHFDQAPGRGVNALQKRGVGGLLAHEGVGNVIGVFFSGVADHLVHGLAGIVKGDGGVAVKCTPGRGCRNTHCISFLSGKIPILFIIPARRNNF